MYILCNKGNHSVNTKSNFWKLWTHLLLSHWTLQSITVHKKLIDLYWNFLKHQIKLVEKIFEGFFMCEVTTQMSQKLMNAQKKLGNGQWKELSQSSPVQFRLTRLDNWYKPPTHPRNPPQTLNKLIVYMRRNQHSFLTPPKPKNSPIQLSLNFTPW